MDDFRHLRILTIVYAGILFLGCLCTFSSPNQWIFPVATLGTAAACIQLSAMWAVLGPYSYWRRTVYALFALFIFGAASVAGMFLGRSTRPIGSDALFEITVFLFTLAWGVWVAAQLPFWICRFLFGWHIGWWRRDEFAPPISISNLMTYTAMIAAALGIYQIVLNVVFEIAPEERTVTLMVGIVGTLGWTLAIFLFFTLPAIYWILYPRDSNFGCGMYATLIVGATIVISVLLILLAGGRFARYITTSRSPSLQI